MKNLAIVLFAALFFTAGCSDFGGGSEQSHKNIKKEKGAVQQWKNYMTRPLKLKKDAKEVVEKARKRDELIKQIGEATER